MKSAPLTSLSLLVLTTIFVALPFLSKAQTPAQPFIPPIKGPQIPMGIKLGPGPTPGPILPPVNTPGSPDSDQNQPAQPTVDQVAAGSQNSTEMPSPDQTQASTATPIAAQNPSSTSPSRAPGTPIEKMVSVQFPHAAVVDVLSFYEQLTGKHTIRDANLTGPELSIMVNNEIPQHEAIALIESSLLLNGYTLIPVDEKTVKVLGPAHPPRPEGLPLYLDEADLPTNGDQLVSFYKPLRFLGPDEAITIIQGVISPNASYSSLVSVPNTGAIIMTDKTPVIRRAIALLDVVDKEPTQIITEFIPLQRANADTVVETLTTMFGNSGSSGGGVRPPVPGQPQGNPGASVSEGGDLHLLSGKPQFIADKRTNRVLIVVKAENYKYLRELIAKLDLPSDSAQPLIRPLNYAQVSDVYSVLITMLQSKEENGNGQPGQPNQPPTPQATPSQNQNNSGGTNSSTGDTLAESASISPQSTTIGNTSIFTDPSGNSIVVYGPPDAKAKAKEIIDILDQRPKQVYLAAVIGELQLTEGVNYGASWFAKLNNGGSNALVGAAVNSSLSGFLTNLVTSSLTNAINSFPSSLSGLTVYGTVAQGIATYAHFLESTGKFRTLSRPVVYTSNNKEAFISSGQQVPVPGTTTASTVGAVGNNALNNVTSTVQYQNVALSLSVIPLINSDHEVNLQILQENDTLGAYVNIGGNSVPNLNTQKLQTTVRVPSGSTIVLGGLISDEKQLTKSGIPYIGKIPILGPLLGGNDDKQRTRNELVVMIQPIVVDDNAGMQQASDAEGGVSDLGKKSTDLQNHLQPTPTPTPKKRFHFFSLPKIDNF